LVSIGFYADFPGGFPSAYLEVPHTSSYMFPRLGSFTVEFLAKKTSDGSRCGTTKNWISKANVFSVSLAYPCFGDSYLIITHPGGSATVLFTNFLGSINLFSKTIHFVLTWKVEDIGGQTYRGTAIVYINGRIASSQTYTYLDNFPNTNFPTPIFIGSSPTSTGYQVTSLLMDQVAIYDKALTGDQVANHYSKAFPYVKMIEYDFASNYWTFGDASSFVNTVIAPKLGTLSGKYVGGENSKIFRVQAGPPQIPNSISVRFQSGGSAVFTYVSQYASYVPRTYNHDYTYEWWFTAIGGNRAVLFSSCQYEMPYNGPLVQLNMRDNGFFYGSIQFSEAEDEFVVNSILQDDNKNNKYYNDDKWHHIAIVRTGINLQLWLDGILQGTVVSDLKTVAQPGQITMMNSMPGNLSTSGRLTHLAYYPFALQAQQIRARVTYAVIYRIRGIVTLLGNPWKALLRFYRSATGEFLQEIESSSQTGNYIASFYDNSNVDILVFDPNDLSIRYRAYGPVSPSEIIDLPIQV
jgi:hypothetical protein